MKRRPRVLLIGRHYWPHGNVDSAGYLGELAVGMHRRGVHVEVCTPRYAASWPERFVIREILVHRPTAAPRSDWTLGRYSRHLTQWIRQHVDSFDAILVDSIREEAVAAIEASRSTRCATLLRMGGWGRHSDVRRWETSRAARRCGVIGKMADAVIAKSAACQRALLAQSYAASRVHRIDPSFSTAPNRTSKAQQAARKVLAGVNSDLAAGADTPVVICNAPMTRESGVILLVQAARHLIARYPDLRLWLIGDGPQRDWIYEQLRSDGLRASIAMPGSFCEIDDLFTAADVYLQTDETGLDYFLPTAVAYELPIVAVDNASTRSVLNAGTRPGKVDQDPSPWIRWIAEPTAKDLRISLADAIGNLPGLRDNAGELRRHLVRVRPQTKMIDAYIDLIEQTATKKSGSNRGNSVEAIS